MARILSSTLSNPFQSAVQTGAEFFDLLSMPEERQIRRKKAESELATSKKHRELMGEQIARERMEREEFEKNAELRAKEREWKMKNFGHDLTMLEKTEDMSNFAARAQKYEIDRRSGTQSDITPEEHKAAIWAMGYNDFFGNDPAEIDKQGEAVKAINKWLTANGQQFAQTPLAQFRLDRNNAPDLIDNLNVFSKNVINQGGTKYGPEVKGGGVNKKINAVFVDKTKGTIAIELETSIDSPGPGQNRVLGKVGGDPKFMAIPNPSGLISQGTINLADRPIVWNEDGSISTTQSFSVGLKEKGVPTAPPISPIDPKKYDQFQKELFGDQIISREKYDRFQKELFSDPKKPPDLKKYKTLLEKYFGDVAKKPTLKEYNRILDKYWTKVPKVNVTKEEGQEVEVLLPQLGPNGEKRTQEEAIKAYQDPGPEQGKHLGKFKSPADANAYSKALHDYQVREMKEKGQFPLKTISSTEPIVYNSGLDGWRSGHPNAPIVQIPIPVWQGHLQAHNTAYDMYEVAKASLKPEETMEELKRGQIARKVNDATQAGLNAVDPKKGVNENRTAFKKAFLNKYPDADPAVVSKQADDWIKETVPRSITEGDLAARAVETDDKGEPTPAAKAAREALKILGETKAGEKHRTLTDWRAIAAGTGPEAEVAKKVIQGEETFELKKSTEKETPHPFTTEGGDVVDHSKNSKGNHSYTNSWSRRETDKKNQGANRFPETSKKRKNKKSANPSLKEPITYHRDG